MKLRSLAQSILFLVPVILSGQARTMPTELPVVAYNELKAYLSLTDAQIQSLQTIQTNRGQASQTIQTQIGEKYTALYALLGSDTATAAQLGQILLDIRGLQRQLPQVDAPFKTQALNVLTQEQKNKLPQLSQALQLTTPAYQAINLLLLDGPPNRVMPVVFGAEGAGSGIGIIRSAPTPSPVFQ